MCADDELHPYLFLFIHIKGKLFHIVLYPLLLERISQVASTGPHRGVAWMIRVAPTKLIIENDTATSYQEGSSFGKNCVNPHLYTNEYGFGIYRGVSI